MPFSHICAELLICPDDKEQSDNKSQNIRYRHRIQHTVKTEEHRQNDSKANAEHDLSYHGKYSRFNRLSHGLQEDEARFIHANEYHHTEIDAECVYSKIGIIAALVCRTEYADKLTGKELHEDKSDSTDTCFGYQQFCEQLTHSQAEPCAHIEAYNGDTACRHTDYDRNNDLEELHDDADHRHRYLRVLLLSENAVHSTVFAMKIWSTML